MELVLAAILAQTTIPRLDVEIEVRPDGTLEVAETIEVAFDSPRHGTYRVIPIKYVRPGAVDTAYSLRLRVISVTDEEGRDLPVKESTDGPDLHLRIGDPRRLISGRQVYRIRYAVARAILRLEEGEELYWNVTGNAWEWEIKSATCRVRLPQGLDPAQVRVRSYTGVVGSQETAAATQVESGAISFALDAPLPPGHGLTIALGFPAGAIDLPSWPRASLWFLRDNVVWIAPLAVPFIVGLFLLRAWRRHGRDPGDPKPLVAQWSPPPGLTAAEVGTLVDESADLDDILSTVLDLAARGYFKIEGLEVLQTFFLKGRDYRFRRQREFREDGSLKAHERTLLEGLFPKGRDEVLLSELRGQFRARLDAMREEIYKGLQAEGYLPGDPRDVRNLYRWRGAVGALICLILSVLFVGVGDWPGDLPVLIVGSWLTVGLATFAMFWAAAPAMPRRTLKGAEAAWHARGLREFLVRVERPELERRIAEDAAIFGRLIPYAIVLGVADAWAEKFRDLAVAPVDWYDAPGLPRERLGSIGFAHDLGVGLDAIACTFTSEPPLPAAAHGGGSARRWGGDRSSPFRGGGSFGRGAGRSGGGFGGGGGGGW